MHRRVVVHVTAVLLVVLVAGVVAWRLLDTRSTYQKALALLPPRTLRTTFTDWADVRREAHAGSVGVHSSRARIGDFLDRAYDLDLTAGSGIDESTATMGRLFGFSALDAQWEALAQSRQGMVDVMRMDDGTDMAAIEHALEKRGYPVPANGYRKGGVWAGGEDLVARLGTDLTPLQQNVVVLPDQHLVLMSDSTLYASRATRVAQGSGRSLADVTGVGSLASAVGDPADAVQWTSTFACQDLTMGSADDQDQRAGDDLVARATRGAGRISPLEGLVMAQHADRSMVVGMHFETSEQASANLQPRVDLASGDAPGQGGSFPARFRLTSGKAQGHDVVLTMKPRAKQVLSDLSTGPVLFATC